MTYYERSGATHVDGSPVFATSADRTAQAKAARALEDAYGYTLHEFGALSAVDWYAVRDGRLVGVAEVKTRSHAHDRYPTVFLNVRKWLALRLAEIGLGVRGIYVVQFTDEVRWISLDDVDASRHAMGGCAQVVKSSSDVEPVIHVPVAAMRRLP